MNPPATTLMQQWVCIYLARSPSLTVSMQPLALSCNIYLVLIPSLAMAMLCVSASSLSLSGNVALGISNMNGSTSLAVAMLQPHLKPAEQCVPPSIDCSLCQHGRFPASSTVPLIQGTARRVSTAVSLRQAQFHGSPTIIPRPTGDHCAIGLDPIGPATSPAHLVLLVAFAPAATRPAHHGIGS